MLNKTNTTGDDMTNNSSTTSNATTYEEESARDDARRDCLPLVERLYDADLEGVSLEAILEVRQCLRRALELVEGEVQS